MKLRVKDNEHFVRDSSNLAILNTDRSAIKSHEQKIAKLNREKHLDEEINNLKSDVAEIKDMFRQILEKMRD